MSERRIATPKPWQEYPKPPRRMQRIESMDEIPDFASEDEERAFWDTHYVAPHLIGARQVVRSRKEHSNG